MSLSLPFSCFQDGLLSQGHSELIAKIYGLIPKVSAEGQHLQASVIIINTLSYLFIKFQMIVCSATLHNFDVKKLAVSFSNV